MERRRQVYEQPQYIDPGMINIPNIQMFNPEVANMAMQNLNESQKRYDSAQGTIAKYLEDMGSVPVRDVDKANVYNKLQSDLDNIHAQVKSGGGDYGAYLPEIIKSLSKARGTMHLASQDYAKEQQHAANIQKLQAEGKLLWQDGVDPRTLSSFNANGQYQKGQDYNYREQSNYDDVVKKGVVEGIDKLVREGRLQGSDYDGLLQQIQTQGLSALDEGKGINKKTRDVFVKELAKGFKDEFERTSTWGIDNKMKSTYKDNSENYIESAINRLSKDVQSRQYMQDPGYADRKRKENEATAAKQVFMGIMGQAGSLQNEPSPIKQEYGSYTTMLDPSFLSRVWSEVSQFGKPKGQEAYTITDLGKTIKSMEDYASKEFPESYKKDKNSTYGKWKRTVDQYKELKKEIDQARDLFGDDAKGKNDIEVSKMLDANNILLTQNMDITFPVDNPDTNKKIKQRLNALSSSNSFYTSGQKGISSNLTDVLNNMGVENVAAVEKYINLPTTTFAYNKQRGQYYVDIPTKYKEDGTVADNPEKKKLYFDLDDRGKAFKEVIMTMRDAIENDRKETNISAFDGMNYEYEYIPSKNKTKNNKLQPKINKWRIGANKYVERPIEMSLEQLYQEMAYNNTSNLFANYTEKDMSFSDQKQNYSVTDLE